MAELTYSEVGEILRLLQSVEGTDVELEWGELRLHVRRGGARDGVVSAEAAASSASLEAATTLSEPQVAKAVRDVEASVPEPPAVVESADDVPEHWVAIESPMVGTFYRSPKPEEPAYVEAGDLVSPGDTVALVEVMKLFTELKSEVSGKVAKVAVDDSTLVEYGQPLIWIEPA